MNCFAIGSDQIYGQPPFCVANLDIFVIFGIIVIIILNLFIGKYLGQFLLTVYFLYSSSSSEIEYH